MPASDVRAQSNGAHVYTICRVVKGSTYVDRGVRNKRLTVSSLFRISWVAGGFISKWYLWISQLVTRSQESC